jgi:hypothetical protein
MRQRASYSSRIPSATRMTVRFTAKGGGVFFRVSSAKAPEARPLERGNKGRPGATFRHPVFGDSEDWVTQPTRPFFFPACQGRQPGGQGRRHQRRAEIPTRGNPMSDLIEVKHEGIDGTARVPRRALKHMDGWKPVDPKVAKDLAAAEKKTEES